jgi:dolichol-phosphate mannosyltransferase
MPPTELMVVLPVYNEQATIRKVINEWFLELSDWTEEFVMLAINDGSTDRTYELLRDCQTRLGSRLEIRDQSNCGHGQSCLEGYRTACDRKIPFVFQLDSDGQCDPQYFFRLWRQRHDYDVVYGVRYKRMDGWRRVLASIVLRGVLAVTNGVWCWDANVPYRMMKTDRLRVKLDLIPTDFHLANVALAVLIRRDPTWKEARVPIVFRERYGGEPTVAIGRFGEKAVELVRQLRGLPRS